MEFDVGNLIYIIATVVALLAGVFGKKKKPTRQAPAGNEAPKLSFFEKLESQLTGLVDEAKMKGRDEAYIEEEGYVDALQVNQEESVAYRAPEPSPEYNSPYTNYEGMFNSGSEEGQEFMDIEAMRVFDHNEGGLHLEDIDDEGSANFDEVVKEFGLEKAVIYSSILERPEY